MTKHTIRPGMVQFLSECLAVGADFWIAAQGHGMELGSTPFDAGVPGPPVVAHGIILRESRVRHEKPRRRHVHDERRFRIQRGDVPRQHDAKLVCENLAASIDVAIAVAVVIEAEPHAERLYHHQIELGLFLGAWMPQPPTRVAFPEASGFDESAGFEGEYVRLGLTE